MPVVRFRLLLATMSVLGTVSCATRSPWVPDALPDITLEERTRTSPAPPTPESIARGGELFHAACTPCHGKKGRGNGETGKLLSLRLPDLTNSKVQTQRSDGEMFYILTHGHRGMPGQGDRWPEEERWSIIQFMRTLDDR